MIHCTHELSKSYSKMDSNFFNQALQNIWGTICENPSLSTPNFLLCFNLHLESLVLYEVFLETSGGN